MGNLYVVRRPQRQAIMLPGQMTKANPSVIIPLYKTERQELDDLVRAIAEKQGQSSQVESLVEQAEEGYENRLKISEARKELRRLMELRRNGNSLMQVGFRKWRAAWFPAVKKEA